MNDNLARGWGGPTQVVFSRLDPILQRLLGEATRLKNLTETTTTKLVPLGDDEELLFRVLKGIVKILDDLTTAIASLGRGDADENIFAPSLVLLADYVALPLTALFHMKLTENSTTTTMTANSPAKSDGRQHQIRQAHIQSLYATVARTMQIYVETCTQRSRMEELTTASSLMPKHLIKFLIALTSRLPAEDRSESNDDDHDKHRKVATTGRLTDESDLAVALLQCINSILPLCSRQDLFEAWHGSLLMRLVDCTTYLTTFDASLDDPRPTYHQPKNNGNGQNVPAGHKSLVRTVHLRALETLLLLLERTEPDPNAQSSSPLEPSTFWRSVFPGVFAAVYKELLNTHRVASSGLSVKVEDNALVVLNKLLQNALMTIDSGPNQAHPGVAGNTSQGVLQQLTNMAKKQNLGHHSGDGNSASIVNSETTKSGTTFHGNDAVDTFVAQVRNRVIAPLTVVVRQESVSKTASTRKLVVTLCRTLLTRTRSIWRGTSLEIVPLEICMGLQRDCEAAIASFASLTIREYMDHMGAIDVSAMVSTIIALVEKLPALVEGGKRVEIRMQLQLLSGYFACAGSKGASALGTSERLRRFLIQIADVNLGSAASTKLASPIDDAMKGSAIEFRHLDLESTAIFREILHVLGNSLGSKYAAIFVDSVLADMIEASHKMPLGDDSLIEWLHEWIGSLVVVREVVDGAFSSNKATNGEKKRDKRRKRILLSLASSTLPLLVESSLWSLQLPHENERSHQDGSQTETSPSPRKLQCNACVVVLLLEYMRAIFNCLEQSTKLFLPTVLYPLIEKASQDSLPSVGTSTLLALESASVACGIKRMENLVAEQQAVAMSAMMGQLRLPGGAQAPGPYDKEGIISVSRSARWTLDTITRSNVAPTDTMVASSVMDLMHLLHFRLSHLFLQHGLTSEEIDDVCRLYISFYEHLLSMHGAEINSVYTYKVSTDCHDPEQPWRDALVAYQKAPANGFHSEKKDDTHDSEQQKLLPLSEKDIGLCSKLNARGCYLLSNSSLRTRILACESLTLGFKFLAFIASNHEDKEDEENTIKNSILRQVADSWPSVRVRLVALSEEISIATTRGVSTVIIPVEPPNSKNRNESKIEIATQRFFLAKLLSLVAHLCQCSGDFMAERFQNDVWPVAARQLGDMLQRTPMQLQGGSRQRLGRAQSLLSKKGHLGMDALTLNSREEKLGSHGSVSERALAISILDCLDRAIANEECGRALYKILSVVGSMLLPFLDADDSDIVTPTMNCLKSILSIDCDVLWRPLLELTGQGLPSSPLLLRTKTNDRAGSTHFSMQNEVPHTSILASRCQELLVFAESLPEQRLI